MARSVTERTIQLIPISKIQKVQQLVVKFIKPSIMTILIPCATGVEAVVKRQLYMLGYGDCPALNGRIVVENCSWKDVARLNVFLRSGERVLVRLATFSATVSIN